MDLENPFISNEFEKKGNSLFNMDRQGSHEGGVSVYVENTIKCCTNKSLRQRGMLNLLLKIAK